ncbi:MAG TPA: hypothetical protein VL172_06130, partial [Kofleriaceae bacterium]|nr:hypothetical protein [Kofleriaceae bacterium]
GNDPDSSCGLACDADGDGVPNGTDLCPGTPTGQPVNNDGCADSQVMPALNDTFPPYGLTWTPTGDPGRAGGLLWDYAGIERDDLFHIYWILCDDPATPCGLSMDGPISVAGESWAFSAADSNIAAGRAVFINTTNILLADTSTVPLSGRMTVTITDGADSPIPFAPVATLGVTARLGTHGAEITGSAFKVTALIEVRDGASAWTPYLDYYDAAQTPDPGPGTAMSLAGSFYDE